MSRDIAQQAPVKLLVPKGTALAVSTLLLVLIIAMGLMYSVAEPFLGTWVAFFCISWVPSQVLIGIWMQQQYPGPIYRLAQPWRGFAYIMLSLLLGAIFAALTFYLVGGGISLPRPPLIHFAIVSVVVTFWFAIVWNLWPLNKPNVHPLWKALILYSVAYLVGYMLFGALFNFDFLKLTPLYDASIDPGGWFSAWYSVSFLVTTVAMIFTLVLLDFWPVNVMVRADQVCGSALLSSLLIVSLSAVVYYVAIVELKWDPVLYLVHGPVTYIFGVFVPLSLYQGKLLMGIAQPYRGLSLIGLSLVSGYVLNRIYFLFADQILMADMASGAPGYALELWAANAMLAFSFPVLVAITDHLEFWPMKTKYSQT